MATLFSDCFVCLLKPNVLGGGGDCPKTHKLESVNFQFATDDSTFSQLRSCFDFVCRIKQQNHDTTVSD